SRRRDRRALQDGRAQRQGLRRAEEGRIHENQEPERRDSGVGRSGRPVSAKILKVCSSSNSKPPAARLTPPAACSFWLDQPYGARLTSIADIDLRNVRHEPVNRYHNINHAAAP